MYCLRYLIFFILCFSFISILSGCVGNKVLVTRYQLSNEKDYNTNSAPKHKIKISNFIDKRADNIDPELIGFYTAAFDVQMGAIYSDIPVFEIIQQAVKSELLQRNYVVVRSNEHIDITGDILTYWLSTETTPLYWDVVGEIEITVKIRNFDSGEYKDFGPYSCRNVKRTYLWPSIKIMETNLKNSLENIIQKMFSDSQLINFIGQTNE